MRLPQPRATKIRANFVEPDMSGAVVLDGIARIGDSLHQENNQRITAELDAKLTHERVHRQVEFDEAFKQLDDEEWSGYTTDLWKERNGGDAFIRDYVREAATAIHPRMGRLAKDLPFWAANSPRYANLSAEDQIFFHRAEQRIMDRAVQLDTDFRKNQVSDTLRARTQALSDFHRTTPEMTLTQVSGGIRTYGQDGYVRDGETETIEGFDPVSLEGREGSVHSIKTGERRVIQSDEARAALGIEGDAQEHILNTSSLGETGRDFTDPAASAQIVTDTRGSRSYGFLGLNSIEGYSAHVFNKEYGAALGLKGKPGTKEFDASWRKIAKDNPNKLRKAQIDYHKKHVIAPAKKALDAFGIAMTDNSGVLSYVADMVVQHGPTGAKRYVEAAKDATSPAQAIELMHAAEVANVDTQFKEFLSEKPKSRQGLLNRFEKRKRQALDAMGGRPRRGRSRQSGSYKVTTKTRDQLANSKSRRGSRLISLDFNDADNPNASGAEIVIPEDASPRERMLAQAFVDQLVTFMESKGHEGYRNRGVKTNKEVGSGLNGYFHTEPFFKSDKKAVNIIRQNAAEYAKILQRTLGQIKGATFIAPHTSTDPGATGQGINERDFAVHEIIPHLMGAPERRIKTTQDFIHVGVPGVDALELDGKADQEVYIPGHYEQGWRSAQQFAPDVDATYDGPLVDMAAQVDRIVGEADTMLRATRMNPALRQAEVMKVRDDMARELMLDYGRHNPIAAMKVLDSGQMDQHFTLTAEAALLDRFEQSKDRAEREAESDLQKEQTRAFADVQMEQEVFHKSERRKALDQQDVVREARKQRDELAAQITQEHKQQQAIAQKQQDLVAGLDTVDLAARIRNLDGTADVNAVHNEVVKLFSEGKITQSKMDSMLADIQKKTQSAGERPKPSQSDKLRIQRMAEEGLIEDAHRDELVEAGFSEAQVTSWMEQSAKLHEDIVGQEEARLRKVEAQIRQDDRYDHLRLLHSGERTEAHIEAAQRSGLFTASEAAAQLKTLRKIKADPANIVRMRLSGEVSKSDVAHLIKDSAYKKSADAVYREQMEAWGQMSPDARVANKAEFVRQVGTVPKSLTSEIEAAVKFGDAEALKEAVALFNDLEKTQHSVPLEEKTSEIIHRADELSSAGMLLKDAVHMAREAAKVKPTDATRLTAKEHKNAWASALGELEGGRFGFGKVDASQAQVDYMNLFEVYYETNGGDGKLAEKMALQQLRKTWAPSFVNNQDGALAKHAPDHDQHFGDPEKDAVWIREEVREIAKDNAGVDSFDDLGFDPNSIFLRPADNAENRKEKQYFLMYRSDDGQPTYLKDANGRELTYEPVFATSPAGLRQREKRQVKNLSVEAAHLGDVAPSMETQALRQVFEGSPGFYSGVGALSPVRDNEIDTGKGTEEKILTSPENWDGAKLNAKAAKQIRDTGSQINALFVGQMEAEIIKGATPEKAFKNAYLIGSIKVGEHTSYIVKDGVFPDDMPTKLEQFFARGLKSGRYDAEYLHGKVMDAYYNFKRMKGE